MHAHFITRTAKQREDREVVHEKLQAASTAEPAAHPSLLRDSP